MGRHLFWMLLLTGLFVLRVLAQLVQAVHGVPFLPAFETWQGSATPYPVLLALQAGVVVVLAGTLWRVRADAIDPRPWRYRACFVLGGAYFAVMGFRLIAGLTFLAEHAWFAESLPALFHLVLAAFVLTLGMHLRGRAVGERCGAPVAARGPGGAA